MSIIFEEGRIKVLNNGAALEYEYHIKDHLGNTRIAFTKIDSSLRINQETHCYPFGLVMKPTGTPSVFASSNRYKYNGIEKIEEAGLEENYFATYRSLDPSIGRWWQVDPKAEKYHSLNAYVSMNNNPISLSDPNGDTPLLGAATNGISNLINGDNFFKGGIQAFGQGLVGGVLSAGIGDVVGTAGGFGKEASRALLHGFSGAVQSSGNSGAGFLSGALSSGLSSGASSLGIGNVGMIGVAGFSGGIGSSLAGGSFWDGARMGLMVSGLNHAAHSGFLGKNIQAALRSGWLRHLFKADATARSVSADGAAGMAIGLEIGSVTAQVGDNKGLTKDFFELGLGVGLEAGAGGGVTKFFYDGYAKDFKLSFISGKSYQLNVSGIFFGRVGGSLSVSENKFFGGRVYGVGVMYGAGFPIPIQGSIQKRMTIFGVFSPGSESDYY